MKEALRTSRPPSVESILELIKHSSFPGPNPEHRFSANRTHSCDKGLRYYKINYKWGMVQRNFYVTISESLL